MLLYFLVEPTLEKLHAGQEKGPCYTERHCRGLDPRPPLFTYSPRAAGSISLDATERMDVMYSVRRRNHCLVTSDQMFSLPLR